MSKAPVTDAKQVQKLNQELYHETYRAAVSTIPELQSSVDFVALTAKKECKDTDFHLKNIQNLLKRGAQINNVDYCFSPIHIAAVFKSEKVLRFLIQNGARPDIAIKERPLENGDWEIPYKFIMSDYKAPWTLDVHTDSSLTKNLYTKQTPKSIFDCSFVRTEKSITFDSIVQGARDALSAKALPTSLAEQLATLNLSSSALLPIEKSFGT